MSHPDPEPPPDPATLPQPDNSSMTGSQLAILMGAALLAALIFLDVVSG